ncbi:3-phosphoshikimate 1-carboxyvinyltransferase, partial [Backusella circina FSU 941]
MKEAELARNIGVLNQAVVGRLARCFASYDLPVSFEEKKIKEIPLTVSTKEIMYDIKNERRHHQDQCNNQLTLLAGIGKTKLETVPDAIVEKIVSPQQLVVPVAKNVAGKTVSLTTPGSKSISNRALLMAALGTGTVRISNLLHSDDTQFMLAALRNLGAADFEWESDGEILVVKGGGGRLAVPDKELYVGNAGTASRFLTTVLTLIPSATSSNSAAILTGNARMKQRPIAPLLKALKENGASIESVENADFLPIAVTPNGGLKGGRIELAASISSQYVSSILLCAPYANEPIELALTGGQVISQPYIDMTIAMMESFGAVVERLPENTYRIQRGVYKNPENYQVESDASSATYPLAIAAITGTTCTVTSIGSASLQGDATFAINVLRPMGCTVVQTETSTTVTGPPIGQLPGNAESENITRITGIANQRVKECNRIAAMVHELTKFGVTASELPDGIQIHGQSIQSLQAPSEGVHCYDDHRVAMSFSCLATVVPEGTIITEKKCVEKTWPTWWDDLEHKLGIQLQGADLSATKSISVDHQKSIVIIGMRGVGKSTLGRFAADVLGFKFIDVDDYFEATYKTTVFEFVNTRGWPEFRLKETESIQTLLSKGSDYGTNYVISCGGGIVETVESRDVLKKHAKRGGKVLHLVRDMDQVMKFLTRDTKRPGYGEDMINVWRRRRSWYKEVCNYEFVAHVKQLTEKCQASPTDWVAVKKDFQRFLLFVCGRKSSRITNKSTLTSFVSLTVKNMKTISNRLVEICEGTDAVELRVDLLENPQDSEYFTEYVGEQLALLRRVTDLPIVYTVRSKGQAGAHSDDDESGMFELLKWGQRWGCEYVDVEMCWSPDTIKQLVSQKGESQIISSWHDLLGKTPWHGDDIQQKYKLGDHYGDIIKLVGTAKTLEDNMTLEAFRRSKMNGKPLIAINMGEAGQLSRILNDYMTPIFHPALPSKAAPGQISLKDILMARHLMGLLPAKEYCLIGTPIQHSVSPNLHNTGFKALGLPHNYKLLECSMVEYAEETLLRDPNFHGASVTIPHKETIMKYLDEISETAKIIGSVNIVTARDELVDGKVKRTLLGDNTDYIGIKKRIQPLLLDPNSPPETALVIGAGGTARAALYALYKLGVQKVYIWNRTVSRAHLLQQSFKDLIEVNVVESLDNDIQPGIIISTVPASSSVELPDAIYGDKKGILCEMAYKPRRTKLLLQAETKGWFCIEGVEVLISQGIAQFEIWTGKRAPVDKMEDHVLKNYE